LKKDIIVRMKSAEAAGFILFFVYSEVKDEIYWHGQVRLYPTYYVNGER
jgi:hypothetical protein